MTSFTWTPDMVIGILDYLISHPRRRWPNLDTIIGGQGLKDMQEMLNRDAVFGGLLILRTLKAMVDRIVRMARLVTLLIER